MISTIKNVNISGPIKDFNKNLSTFFTSIAIEVQNYLIFSYSGLTSRLILWYFYSLLFWI